MLVTVDTEQIDLVHNTEVCEAALNELPAGWIVDLEFFRAGTFSFVKTYDGWFAGADDSFIWEGVADFIETIQGNNPLKEEAMSVSFHEPLSSDIAKQHNKALEEVMNAKNGETLLDGRFVKYGDFFLDTQNDLKPMGLLAVANNLFLKEYSEDHDITKLFTKGHDKK
nr:MAG TPA: hypothetical protein [Caudoviricetes sp.]